MATRPVQHFETFLSCLWREVRDIQRLVGGTSRCESQWGKNVMSENGTCLIHHVDETLCIVPTEAMDRVSLIFT